MLIIIIIIIIIIMLIIINIIICSSSSSLSSSSWFVFQDVHRAVKIGMETGLPCLSVVNVVGSHIARTTGCHQKFHAQFLVLYHGNFHSRHGSVLECWT
jgi:hypothetical protein